MRLENESGVEVVKANPVLKIDADLGKAALYLYLSQEKAGLLVDVCVSFLLAGLGLGMDAAFGAGFVVALLAGLTIAGLAAPSASGRYLSCMPCRKLRNT